MNSINNDCGQINADKTNKSDNEELHLPWWTLYRRKRFIVTFMMSLGCFNIYSMRANLSVAIVAMTKNNLIILENGTQTYQKEFDWNSAQQGILLGGFFWGSITTQLIGGYFAEKYGGKLVFGLGIITTAVLTMLTPIVAKQSYYALLVLRILVGIFEGVAYPAILSIFARWAPPLERSRMATITYSGSTIGALVSLTLSGVIGDYIGWESIFYIFGGVAILWYIIWLIWIAESPSSDRWIRKTELNYILSSLNKSEVDDRKIAHPWKDIFLSVPFWAASIASFCEYWGFTTLLTQLPTFMSDVLDFDLTARGSLSALPYLAMSIIALLGGLLADFVLKLNILTVTQVRKIFTCTAFISQTIFMLAAAFLMSPVGSTACLTLAVGLGGLTYSGFTVNFMELGPSHGSVLVGVSNTFAAIPGMVTSTITGFIVQNGTEDEWRIVFYLAASVYLFGCIFYGIFASAKLQPWSKEFKEMELKEVH